MAAAEAQHSARSANRKRPPPFDRQRAQKDFDDKIARRPESQDERDERMIADEIAISQAIGMTIRTVKSSDA